MDDSVTVADSSIVIVSVRLPSSDLVDVPEGCTVTVVEKTVVALPLWVVECGSVVVMLTRAVCDVCNEVLIEAVSVMLTVGE